MLTFLLDLFCFHLKFLISRHLNRYNW